MDVAYFLRDRIAFIRQFYDAASLPFCERKRKIKAGEPPFVPPYSEDGEPPFLTEWMEADESLQVLGYSCMSMLAAALHLYLQTLERELGQPVGDSFKSEFKKGWLNGYTAYFSDRFGIEFAKAPVDVALLEELVLARNRIQHADDVISPRTTYSRSDLKKLPHAFFVDETERSLFSKVDEMERSWLFPPTIHVTETKLRGIIAEVEKFNDWLEAEIGTRVYVR